MQISLIENEQDWENFLSQRAEKSFLQAWAWGEFCKSMGKKIWRLGVQQGQELVAVALTEKKAAKRGVFLLIPHGPVMKDCHQAKEIITVLSVKLKELAEKEGAAFVRINPILKRTRENSAIFKNLGFRPAPLQMHPEASWQLDLTPSPEQLFSKMRKTTRYLIKKAEQNKEITVSESADLKDVKIFSSFHNQVSKRQNFVPFSLEYLEKEFSCFNKNNQVCLFFARCQDEIAAGSFVIFWSGMAFYHHAISAPKFAKLSIPYLLLWEAIKKAKNRGCLVYDFWGFVDPDKQPNHPWAGPTLFKMGFGGQAREYVKTQDLIISSKYWLTYVFEKLRKMKRKL